MTSRTTHLSLPGRTLLLCRDPERISLQLQGIDLSLLEAGPLRDDISTDEITPVAILSHYDDKLGRYPYTGFRTDGQSPIGVNTVRDGRFSVVVAGQRYGRAPRASTARRRNSWPASGW